MRGTAKGLLYVLLAIVIFALTVFYYSFRASEGHHLQWSWANGDFIWVDKEGKPLP